jgi:glucose/arabinose dehydrogenase
LLAATVLVLLGAVGAWYVHQWLQRPAGELAPGLERGPVVRQGLEGIDLSLERIVTAPAPITFMTSGPGQDRLYVLEKRGRIAILKDGALASEPLLDLRSRVQADGQEQGLLGLAFGPEGRHFYVNYTAARHGGDTVVARYPVAASGEQIDADEEEVLLTIEQPASNHNGGHLAFGPDGYLYIGTGDGGIAHDPWDHAESLDTLLGKLLRIDVSAEQGYAVPEDNPFTGREDARGEIWAYGLRNPWRFSFDRETGALHIADVGQTDWEEVNLQSPGAGGGQHYGWDTLEGRHCHEPRQGCDPSGTEIPVATYDHDLGCSITGGYVYRGERYPAMSGLYLFGDFCSGRIWALERRGGDRFRMAELLDTELGIASFAQDAAGELYVLALSGGIHRIVNGR